MKNLKFHLPDKMFQTQCFLRTDQREGKTEEIQPLTINQTTFFANRTKTVAMKTDSASKTPALANEAFIALRTITYGKQYSLDIFDPTNLLHISIISSNL